MINSVHKSWTRILLILFVCAGAGSFAVAQNPAGVNPPFDQRSNTEINESFELNIPDRHITESDFNAGTDVELAARDRTNLRVRVGVGLHADQIDVQLRNVFGTVRFQGSLQKILELLNLRVKTTPSQ